MLLTSFAIALSGCHSEPDASKQRIKLAYQKELRKKGPFDFVILKANISALYRKPMAPAWQNLSSNLTIPENTLFHVLSKGTMQLRFRSNTGQKWNSGVINLEFTHPVSFFATRDILKKFKTDILVLDKIPKPDEAVEEEEGPLDYVFWSFEQALEKTLLFIKKTETTKSTIEDIQKEGKQPITVSVSKEKLSLVEPSDNTLLYTQRYPKKLFISWMPAPTSKKITYDIYVWPAKKIRPAPRARTKNTQFYVTLSETGSYHVQVESADGSYQSKAHTLFIQNMEEGGKPNRSGTGKTVNLTLPEKNSVYLTASEKAEVYFTWDADLSVQGRKEVVLYSSEKTTILPIEEDQYSLVTKLAVGKYFYWVQAAEQGRQQTSFSQIDSSKVQVLDVVRVSPGKVADEIAKIIRSGTDRHISINGLF